MVSHIRNESMIDNLKSYMIQMCALFLSPAELAQGRYRLPPAFFGGPTHNPALAAPDPSVSTLVSWTVAQYNSGDALLELVAGHGAGIMNHSTFVGREVGGAARTGPHMPCMLYSTQP